MSELMVAALQRLIALPISIRRMLVVRPARRRKHMLLGMNDLANCAIRAIDGTIGQAKS